MSITQMALPFIAPIEACKLRDSISQGELKDNGYLGRLFNSRTCNDDIINRQIFKDKDVEKDNEKEKETEKNSNDQNKNQKGNYGHLRQHSPNSDLNQEDSGLSDNAVRGKVERDSFLSRYINQDSPVIKNRHQQHFAILNKQRKVKLLEVYQKYLNLSDVKLNFRYDEEFPSAASDKSHDITRKLPTTSLLKKASPSRTPPFKLPPIFKPATLVPAEPEKQNAQVLKPNKSHVTKVLPTEFMECSIDDLIALVDRMLYCLITLNDKLANVSIPPYNSSKLTSSNGLLTRYHSKVPPSISIKTYLTRLTKFNNFSPVTLLTTIYYIDLLSHHYQPYFTLNSWTVHRFLLVGTMLSQKLMEDFFYTNDHYAKVGGVAIGELNCLELDFLTRVEWRCLPTKHMDNEKISPRYIKDVLDLYYSRLIQMMGKNTTKSDLSIYILKDQDSSLKEGVELNDEFNDDEDEDLEDILEYETAAELYSEPSEQSEHRSDSTSDELEDTKGAIADSPRSAALSLKRRYSEGLDTN